MYRYILSYVTTLFGLGALLALLLDFSYGTLADEDPCVTYGIALTAYEPQCVTWKGGTGRAHTVGPEEIVLLNNVD